MKKLVFQCLRYRHFCIVLFVFLSVDSFVFGDNLIGMHKLTTMASHWLDADCSTENDWCAGSDVDENGAVNLVDLAYLSQKWEKYRRPNILFILIDDLGKEWLNVYGGIDINTPNIDGLADNGMRFENAYSMPQCVPSRMALMTGQYPWRNGFVHHWDVPAAGWKFPEGVPPVRYDHNVYASFGRLMQSRGYKTAVAGKWQLNDFRRDPLVMNKHGFDDFCMWPGKEYDNPPAAIRYYDPYIHTVAGSEIRYGEFGPDIFTDFLLDFMTTHKDEPMMLYYPMALTHNPFIATPLEPDIPDDKAHRTERLKAMVRYTDYLLSRFVSKLEELGIRDHTIIFWTTDNGTASKHTGAIDGRPVIGGKTKITENGINAPFIVNCPGIIPAGVVTDVLTDFTDMFPTFAHLSGAQMPDGYVFDGYSIADVLIGKDADGSREWICGLGSGGGTLNLDRLPPMEGVDDYQAVNVDNQKQRGIRDKRYKMLVDSSTGTTPAEPNGLFDLWLDPGETIDLTDSTAPEHTAARLKLEAVHALFPSIDATPQYGPLVP
ncbi:MAG: sulfatase-like hydrolase/transferase [Phycisphaerae bacterium]|nr:sulfatase-like hydrolase/transferase [Phycisphaerae bacterium]